MVAYARAVLQFGVLTLDVIPFAIAAGTIHNSARMCLGRIGTNRNRKIELNTTNRRDILHLGATSLALPLWSILNVGCGPRDAETTEPSKPTTESSSIDDASRVELGATMKIQYLEIVSPDVDALCTTYKQLHDMTFGEPDMNLGNARTAKLPNGGLLGIRAPLRDTEIPVVRPYILVEDIHAAVSKAAAEGAEIALPPMQLPGHGTCAIFIQGGIEHGLWQL